ncbi:ATP-binding protein [Ramlibacter rhizophilus]|uniref:histidine kinase n=1 Tax=Ramlibacter rhizophilus TaxID=1781167 RepID=A0A4Z0BZB8_9BURK|nr:ATP-binding protein [Ramlibacter rhizophilus]TFZ03309.1 PAS domain S-box protein [Ramlibacter rhizophilus]
MIAPPLAANESERLADLHDYDILDSPSEQVFDEIAELAAAICGTPYAAVTFLAEDRQWLKSRHGLRFDQTSRDQSVCGHAVLQERFFEVPDLQQDVRFMDNPLLALDHGARLRFYGGSQLRSEKGNNLGMLCVLDDQPRTLSDEQRRAMEQLADVVIALLQARRDRSRHEYLGLLLDRLRVGITVIDGESHRYLHANANALADLGLPMERLRQMSPVEAVPALSQQRFDASMQRLQGGAAQASDEYTEPGPDGLPRTTEIRWERLPARPRELVVAIARDISERKALERMKDELVSLINHELRTPLTSIRGAIKLLDSGAAGALPDAAAKLVSVASQSTDRLLAIVNDLLDLDRMTSQRMSFRLEPLEAGHVLEQAAQAALPLAQAASVRLDVRAPGGLLLRADAQRLQQVLANLVSNAIKFAPDGSQVELRARTDEGGVWLGVSDHGQGVPAHFRPRVFERFAQADARTTRAQGGSGLGLSIARQMTEQMGGRIGFESEPGHTTFHLWLPGATS